MRYVCGNCASTAAGPGGCSDCDGPAFDLDSPVGEHDMREYRAMCRDREEGQVLAWVPVIPAVIVPIFLMTLVNYVGLDPFGPLPWWAKLLEWLTGGGVFVLAFWLLR